MQLCSSLKAGTKVGLLIVCIKYKGKKRKQKSVCQRTGLCYDKMRHEFYKQYIKCCISEPVIKCYNGDCVASERLGREKTL